MKEFPFNDVYKVLNPIFPTDWSRIVVLFCSFEDRAKIDFFVRTATDQQISAYDIVSKDSGKLSVLSELSNILEASQDEKNKWTSVAVVINSDGTVNAEFDYSTIDENSSSYMDELKKRYI